jgi:hypothetical protein
MPTEELTIRQQILREITGTLRSSRQLAELIRIPERDIEDHLTHLVRSVSRDRTRRFVMDPSACQSCSYVFRERTRLRRPSRCPRCRSEDISPPRFGIDAR